MTSHATLHSTLTHSASRGPWIDRIARRLVWRRLRSIREGRVLIDDGGGRVAFGRASGAEATTATVVVRDSRFYRRVLLGGSIGAARAYREGLFTCDDLTALLRIFAREIEVTDECERGPARIAMAASRLRHALRRNTRRGARRNIHDHYDLGNEFFETFLDETMTYSSGVFERRDATLRDASIAKLDRICRKLALGPDDHVVEIGSGWGSFAIHAASHYGCRVTTTTISRAQHDLARRRIDEAQVADRVRVVLGDYRDLEGCYDKLVSIEMIEAVGHEFLPTFFRTCRRLLPRDGMMALQAITMPDHRYDAYRREVDFVRRDVFPGSCVPSIAALGAAIARGSDLRIVDLEDLTPHYARTLHLWRRRFLTAVETGRLDRRPAEFLRLWDFYLSYCEAGFAERCCGVVQMVLVRPGCRTVLDRAVLPGHAAGVE